jgi:hypothetical protein
MNPIFGAVFGTLYDLSTITILCLAGASVTLGLRSLVPQYLSSLGMELKWAHKVGAVLHLFNLINLITVTIFRASVAAQRWAYITSVVVLMSSAAVAAVIDLWHSRPSPLRRLLFSGPFAVTGAIFLLTAGVAMFRNPEGLWIALWFILVTLVTSIASRLIRSTELRFAGFEFQDENSEALWERLKRMKFPVLVPHRPGRRSLASKEEDIRRVHRLDPGVPVVFIEAELGDASDFFHRPVLSAWQEDGRVILRVIRCASIAHVLAAIGLELSKADSFAEMHFGWSEESSIAANINFLFFGEGNIPWLVRELMRKAEPDAKRQPRIVIG